MNIFFIVLKILSLILTIDGRNKDFYFITTPNVLIAETSHQFFVHTSVDLVIMVETVHLASNIKQQSPTYFINKDYGSINYYIPFVGNLLGDKIRLNFRGDICNDGKNCQTNTEISGKFFNETYDIEVINKNFIIFAESEKPIYKPGEKIKLRFMPIYPTNLMRQPEALGRLWEIVLNDKNVYQLKDVKSSNQNQNFELIYIEDSDRVRVKQWRNVSIQEAMNLEFQLTQDPVFGDWKANAIYNQQEEQIEFKIQKYVLPRFVVEVFPPNEILGSDKLLGFKVCAKYSTGKLMNAQIHGTFCFLFNNNDSKCRNFKSNLKREFCLDVSLNISSFFNISFNHRFSNIKSVINVTVIENGTTSSISKVAYGKNIMFTPYKIVFKSVQYFKPGLPYFGQLALERHNNEPQANTTLSISVNGYFTAINWGFTRNYISDKNGLINFVIPVIPADVSISISVISKDTLKEPMISPSLYQRIQIWESKDKYYLQIQPINKESIKCPGNVKLNVLTNYDVSSIDMYVQILSRGQITYMNKYPSVPVKCFSRNDNFGHYTCAKGENIVCLAGWSGDNCQKPICRMDCVNGICEDLDVCTCKSGWTGKTCETCTAPAFCRNGYCKYGNDCICYKGWQGYDCSIKGPKIHYYTNQTTTKKDNVTKSTPKQFEKQTLFERNIDVSLLKQMGPDIHIVIYFITPGNEVVADSIEISNGLENCSHLGGGKFEFNKQNVLPKSDVILNIDSGMKNTSCAVRIGDIALSQFGSSGNVDLPYLIQTLIKLNHKITLGQKDKSYQYRCLPNRRYKRMILPGRSEGYDSKKVLVLSGFNSITNTRVINQICRYFYSSGFNPSYMVEDSVSIPRVYASPGLTLEKTKQKISYLDSPNKQNMKIEKNIVKKIRDFFPESWLFSYYNHTIKQIQLTVPDSLTTWQANSYCMTEKGIWIGPTQSLKVIMPFFVDIYVPYSIKLEEELQLPVKIFNYAEACYEINVKLNVNESEIKIIGLKSTTLCVCANNEKAIYFNLKPKVIGKLNITVEAESKYSYFCSGDDEETVDIEMFDSIRRQLLVEPQGVPSETTFSELICNKNEEFGIFELFMIPTELVAGSLRSYLIFNGDVMGQTFDNLDKMVKMPYGCGEQNMMSVVPSIYVLNYLKGLKIDNVLLSKKAREYVIQGYNRQMGYKHFDGSFSAFGKTDKAGSTWLTSFVLKSFSDASKYVTIEENMLKEAVRYLEKMQLQNGCFDEKGKLLSSALAGGVKKSDQTDQSLLTAYVLLSLRSIKLTKTVIDLEKAMTCVISGLTTNPSNYRLALTAYVISLYQPRGKHYNSIMEQLVKRSVTSGRYRYWSFDKDSVSNLKINAVDIETTGYAFLALLDYQSLSDSLKTAYWLSNQRNSLGGYYSTQDTVVALNALAVFAELIGLSNITNLNVSIVLNGKQKYNDLITSDNRLVSRKISLGVENITDIAIKTKGNGCVSVQLASLYNIHKLYSTNDTFKLSIKSEVPSKDKCNTRKINICFAYLRKDKNSNMILLTVDYPSGWHLLKNEMNNLLQNIITPLNRIDFQNNRMELYYDAFSYNDAFKEYCLSFQLNQKSTVSNIKPAIVRIIDYYSPNIYTDSSYIVDNKMCNETNKVILPIIPKLLSCPTCVDMKSTIEFINTICDSWFAGLVTSDKSGIKNRTFYQAQHSTFFEWKVDLEPSNCSCLKTWSFINRDFIILSRRYLPLNDKIILSNYSTMFPIDSVKIAYKLDLRFQCSAANILFKMLDRVMPNFYNSSTSNHSCASCILNSNLYFSVKNMTAWYCANYTDWKLEITSLDPIIKGILRNNKTTVVYVNIEFPDNLCYCYEKLKNKNRTFRIVDLKDTIKNVNNTLESPMKIFMDNKYEIIEEIIFSRYSYIKCNE